MPTLAVTALALAAFQSYGPVPTTGDPLPRKGVFGLGLTQIPAEVQSQNQIPAGQGLLATTPVPGQTAAKMGVEAGDILLTVNGQNVAPGVIQEVLRTTSSGKTLTLQVLRKGERKTLSAPLMEKPRDPGTADYEVIYSHVISNGQRMRTIITRPRKPGTYPAWFHIQGFSPISYDYVLEGNNDGPTDFQRLNAPMISTFAKAGFITMRVEKPGVGDSEGGPFAQVDYLTELDIYRQALKQLKATPGVDSNNVFIFGHSMGGAFGPMIAAENKVKGIVTYGTATRTWFEYILETSRTQSLLAGATEEAVDDSVRITSRILARIFLEGQSPEQVKKELPDLAPVVDSLMPGGLFNQKSIEFWRQLGQINFPREWSKTGAYVLAVRGVSDFVTYDECHTLIADTINRTTPGRGQFLALPNSDHVMNARATEKESQQNWPNGNHNPAMTEAMLKWIREVMAKPN